MILIILLILKIVVDKKNKKSSRNLDYNIKNDLNENKKIKEKM